MKNFVALDVETANNHLTAICSIGAVMVKNGEIAERFYRLVRPIPNFYADINIRIHGICPADTEQAASFAEVWAELRPLIGNLPLVAHNKAFDENRIRATLEYYGLQTPSNAFLCTVEQARKVLGKRLNNLRLPTVAAYFGYKLKSHHNALADAEACAYIAERLFR